MTDAASLKARLDVLEAQLREQTDVREQATLAASRAGAAMLQLQGAIAVVKDLLTPKDLDPPEPKELAS